MLKTGTHAAEFIGCTDCMLVTGHGNKGSMLVRIESNRNLDGSVSLTSRGGNTGTRITKVEEVLLSEEDWSDRPNDPTWVFAKAGWTRSRA